jgi:hypothetical protein
MPAHLSHVADRTTTTRSASQKANKMHWTSRAAARLQGIELLEDVLLRLVRGPGTISVANFTVVLNSLLRVIEFLFSSVKHSREVTPSGGLR